MTTRLSTEATSGGNGNVGNASLSPTELTRRSVRAFWADGLWDFAVAGICVILGIWVYPLTLLRFPMQAWAWPFSTLENRNSLGVLGAAWLLIIIGVGALFLWIAWKIVIRLKERFIAPYTGNVKHAFWLPIENKVILWYLVVYLAGGVVLALLFAAFKGGPHMLAVFYILSPAAILFRIGQVYNLPRYRWIAAVGFIVSLGLEAFATTHAPMSTGPRDFWEVSAFFGQPAMACAVFSLLLIVSGVIGFIQVRKVGDDR